jgi:thiamine pyrophosphate-dependent acetolactate synthase large subunit-like protein
MKLYERLAQDFVAEGVTDVFGMMGDGNMHWLEALHTRGVNVYDVRHEGAGLAMADGWARVARDRHVDVPGVCTATHGPGVAQFATTMLVASRARTPLVAFVGEGPDGDEEFVQRLDQKRFAAATECEFIRVVSPDTADEEVRKAFYRAKYESRPILLAARVETQMMDCDDSEEYTPSAALHNTQPLYPHPASLQQAAEMIAGSTHPVVLVGRGAIWSGAGDAALRLAERIGALVATTLMAKNWLSHDQFHAGISGLYSTKAAMELFEEADCVIALGASLNKYTTEYGYLYPKAKYIQVDASPHVVMGGGRTADLYVRSDARLAAEGLDELLGERGFQAAGYRTPDVKTKLESAFEDHAEFDSEPGTVDPRQACLTLDEVLPPEIGLVLGGGHQITFGTMLFTRGRSLMLANQHFGCIGQGLTTAIGAVIAAGMHPTLLVEGDAGLLMHLAEFETAARYNLPLLVVVINDQALGAEYHKLHVSGMRSEFATIPTPDLGAVGVALGGRGRLARTVDDVRAAAEEFVAQPGTMMVDVRVSRKVLSVPYRRLHYGQDA